MDNVINAVNVFRQMHNAQGPDRDSLEATHEKLVQALTPEEKAVHDFGVRCYFMGEDDAHRKITGMP